MNNITKSFFLFFLLPCFLFFSILPPITVNILWVVFSIVLVSTYHYEEKMRFYFFIIFLCFLSMVSISRGFGYSPLLLLSSVLIFAWFRDIIFTKKDFFKVVFVYTFFVVTTLIIAFGKNRLELHNSIGLNRFGVVLLSCLILYTYLYKQSGLRKNYLFLVFALYAVVAALYSYLGASKSTLLICIFFLGCAFLLISNSMIKWVLLIFVLGVVLFFAKDLLSETILLARIESFSFEKEPRYYLILDFFDNVIDYGWQTKSEISGVVEAYGYNLHNAFLTSYLYSGFATLFLHLLLFMSLIFALLKANMLIKILIFSVIFKMFTDNVFIYSIESFFFLMIIGIAQSPFLIYRKRKPLFLMGVNHA